MGCRTAGNDMAKGRASSLTEAGLATRRSMMARRVGSASALNTVSRPDWLGTQLSVRRDGPKVKDKINYSTTATSPSPRREDHAERWRPGVCGRARATKGPRPSVSGRLFGDRARATELRCCRCCSGLTPPQAASAAFSPSGRLSQWWVVNPIPGLEQSVHSRGRRAAAASTERSGMRARPPWPTDWLRGWSVPPPLIAGRQR